MSENKTLTFVTLGNNAEIFHDVYAGLTLTKGQVAALTQAQRNKRKIAQAIGGGHLSVISEMEAHKMVGPENFRKMTQNVKDNRPGKGTIEGEGGTDPLSGAALLLKFKESYSVESNSADDVMKGFTKDQMELIATELGIVKPANTKALIFDQIEEELDKEEE